MSRKLSELIAPAYLLLCLIFGGSVQNIWGNFALQFIGVAILVSVIARPRAFGKLAGLPLFVGLSALTLVCLQLVPLPPSVWAALPGRAGFSGGYSLLRMPLPWLPISETPFESVATLFALLPPFATFAAILASDSDSRAAGALVGLTVAAILLGALQVASGSGSRWYFYPITNTGAVGFFANSNHIGTLLIATIPFLGALLGSGTRWHRRRGIGAAIIIIAAATLGLILIGIALNRSLAALLLVLPVLLATGLMISAGWRFRWIGIPVAMIGLAAAVTFIGTNPLNSSTASRAKQMSIQSRQAIWSNTGRAIRDSFPVGTGLGSFAAVYPLYEDPDAVNSTYVNHAHNDYLELTLELGLPGALLLLLFLGWWVVASLQIWSSNMSSPCERAATIASAAILAHSAVDYPLRTSAIAAVFAMCVAIIARFDSKESALVQLGSTGLRHVKIG